jgi:hypothetical protein
MIKFPSFNVARSANQQWPVAIPNKNTSISGFKLHYIISNYFHAKYYFKKSRIYLTPSWLPVESIGL